MTASWSGVNLTSSADRPSRSTVAVAAFALVVSGICFGLVTGVVLIPEPPEEIYVPVDRPFEPSRNLEGIRV